MKTRLVLKPGSRGTRKLLAEHGKRLVCVRYRYDLRLGRRWKTVELVVDDASSGLRLAGPVVGLVRRL